MQYQPTVTVCTITHNRHRFLPLLKQNIQSQSYPAELLQWVIVDDSTDLESHAPSFPGLGLGVTYHRLISKLPIGRKRNLSHELCLGDIIIYMDDDDFYPPTRVEHAVDALVSSDNLIAGSTYLPILFVKDCDFWIAGPYSKNHATAGTFAFKRELLVETSYQDDAVSAEEKHFLKNYTIPMVQLQPLSTIICIAHASNTFNKDTLRQQAIKAGGSTGTFKPFQYSNDSQRSAIADIARLYDSVG
mgnify:FL=1